MSHETANAEDTAISRRNLLYAATAAFGVAGAAAAAWPFIAQMSPDAGVRAAGDVVGVDLAELRLAEQKTVRWHSRPIFVVRRTPAMLAAMQESAFVARLADPHSHKRQQPSYAANWHRSIDPAYAILVGVCTWCACVPQYLEETSVLGTAGGYVCPCCASHFDPAGRAYDGVASYNLAVPPHAIERHARVLIGKNMPGEIFSFESIERI